MHLLRLDIETRSGTLIECGTHKYIDDPDFRILCIGYRLNDGPYKVIDLTKYLCPMWLVDAIFDDDYIKTAWNAAFERLCLQRYYRRYSPVRQWRCTMVKAARAGYPLRLELAGKAAGITDEKLKGGKKLVTFFCVPRKPTKNDLSKYNEPEAHPVKWRKFLRYNGRDVKAENQIDDVIAWIPEEQQALYEADQWINDSGLKVDRELVKQCIDLYAQIENELIAEARALTGCENPNSLNQIKAWIKRSTGKVVKSLAEEAAEELAKTTKDPKVKRYLVIRKGLSNTSVKKYHSIYKSLQADDFVRGFLQIMGALRTGRWAGRRFQFQNLPRMKLELLAEVREFVRTCTLDELKMIFSNPADILKGLIRTVFIAPVDRKLIVSDFTAIEAVITAWYSNEQWRLDAFKRKEDIYVLSYAKAFKIPVDEVTDEQRAIGKIMELALGFGGADGAMLNFGADKKGLDEETRKEIVESWREANPKIVKFWGRVNKAAILAVNGTPNKITTDNYSLKFFVKHDCLHITLPSGRNLRYQKPHLRVNRFGKMSLWYYEAEGSKWMPENTYGGKLAENIIQATAADLQGEALIRLLAAKYFAAAHTHDEIIADMYRTNGSPEEMAKIMSVRPEWARRMPISCKAFETQFYKK